MMALAFGMPEMMDPITFKNKVTMASAMMSVEMGIIEPAQKMLKDEFPEGMNQENQKEFVGRFVEFVVDKAKGMPEE